MRSVPVHFIDLACSDLDADLRERFLDCGVMLGSRVELDLDEISLISESHGDQLEAYSSRVDAFWDAYVETGVGGECLVTERSVATFTKVDKKGSKIFLKDQISALEDLNGVGDALGELFSGTLDSEKLSGLGVSVSEEGNLITLRVEVQGKELWPTSLGGNPGRGEVARIFEIKVSHAGSHDRKSQRLLEVRVKAREVWPV